MPKKLSRNTYRSHTKALTQADAKGTGQATSHTLLTPEPPVSQHPAPPIPARPTTTAVTPHMARSHPRRPTAIDLPTHPCRPSVTDSTPQAAPTHPCLSTATDFTPPAARNNPPIFAGLTQEPADVVGGGRSTSVVASATRTTGTDGGAARSASVTTDNGPLPPHTGDAVTTAAVGAAGAVTPTQPANAATPATTVGDSADGGGAAGSGGARAPPPPPLVTAVTTGTGAASVGQGTRAGTAGAVGVVGHAVVVVVWPSRLTTAVPVATAGAVMREAGEAMPRDRSGPGNDAGKGGGPPAAAGTSCSTAHAASGLMTAADGCPAGCAASATHGPADGNSSVAPT